MVSSVVDVLSWRYLHKIQGNMASEGLIVKSEIYISENPEPKTNIWDTGQTL